MDKGKKGVFGDGKSEYNTKKKIVALAAHKKIREMGTYHFARINATGSSSPSTVRK